MTLSHGSHGSRGWRDQLAEWSASTVHLLRWIVLGSLSGALAGLSSFVFLDVLDRITKVRVEHGWLLFLLPVAGLALGLVHHHFGGRAVQGNALLLEQIHEPTEWVPKRMAPLVLVGTWITHLFGGSAGREGTALQMSGSLTDSLSRVLRLDDADRRMLLVAALAGGFGAVFGVPLAGTVFALEVQSIGRVRYEALLPAFAASIVGDLVVTGLGYQHHVRPQIVAHLDAWLVLRLAVAGVAMGLVGAAFAWGIHSLKRVLAARVTWPPLRPVIGGVAVVGLALLVGRDYLGLSLPLADRALAGEHLHWWVFALKVLFTVITLGCSFPGGEVTPLFVIGAALGATLAAPLGLPVALLAAVGFVALFAGAANTPLACTIMGVELFGAGAVVPFAVGCIVAYLCSGHHGIYPTQRLHVAKLRSPSPRRP